MRPRGVSQIGESIGNKSTETGKVKGIPSEKIQGARSSCRALRRLETLSPQRWQRWRRALGGRSMAKAGVIKSTAHPILAFPGSPTPKGQWPDITQTALKAQKEK